MQLESILRELGQICATRNALVQLDQNSCKNSILNFPAKFEQECAEPFCKYSDDSSHCTAKASLKKGSSWPPESILYRNSFRVDSFRVLDWWRPGTAFFQSVADSTGVSEYKLSITTSRSVCFQLDAMPALDEMYGYGMASLGVKSWKFVHVEW